MSTRTIQFGAYMQQKRLDEQQMQRLLYEHIARMQQPQQHIVNNQGLVLHMVQPPPMPHHEVVQFFGTNHHHRLPPAPVQCWLSPHPPPQSSGQ